jgi:ABC-type uncharacterized transport system substrate-binding protein
VPGLKRLTVAAVAAIVPAQAMAHPHIFIDAKFEAVAAADGTLSELRNTWTFDEVFSSSVLLDFDKNGDMTLDKAELSAVSKTVTKSLAQYNYYTNVTIDGKTVVMAKPDAIQASFRDGALTLSFTLKPAQKTLLKGTTIFGIYDKTLYTALDFANDTDLASSGPGFTRCSRKVVRPNPKEILAQNQAALTTLFFNDPMGTDYSQLVATRLEIKC